MLVCLEEKIYWLIYRIILYLKKKKKNLYCLRTMTIQIFKNLVSAVSVSLSLLISTRSCHWMILKF